MSEIIVQMIPVDQLVPNEWNPNKQTAQEYAQTVAEVRHTGQVAKPILVRRLGRSRNRYEISDGEHNWRAAKDCGHAEVPCVVRKMSDLEAMRQTFKRNQHGTHNPVLEGRMFRAMREESGLSNVEFSKSIDVSEGKVRNAILYADASDIRSEYATRNPERYAAEVGSEVLDGYLPGKDSILASIPIRTLRALKSYECPVELWYLYVEKVFKCDEDFPWFADDALGYCRGNDLWKFYDEAGQYSAKTINEFVEVTGIGTGLEEVEGYQELINRLIRQESFNSRWLVGPFLERGLTFEGDPESGFRMLVSCDQYFDAIVKFAGQTDSAEKFAGLLSHWVDLERKNQGLRQEDQSHPITIAVADRAKKYPKCIGEAPVSVHERSFLMDIFDALLSDGHDKETVEEQVQAMIHTKIGREYLLSDILGDAMSDPTDLPSIAREVLDAFNSDEAAKKVEELCKDRSTYESAIVKAILEVDTISKADFNGPTPEEFIRQRLQAIPRPEVELMACLFAGIRLEGIADHWLDAVKKESDLVIVTSESDDDGSLDSMLERFVRDAVALRQLFDAMIEVGLCPHTDDTRFTIGWFAIAPITLKGEQPGRGKSRPDDDDDEDIDDTAGQPVINPTFEYVDHGKGRGHQYDWQIVMKHPSLLGGEATWDGFDSEGQCKEATDRITSFIADGMTPSDALELASASDDEFEDIDEDDPEPEYEISGKRGAWTLTIEWEGRTERYEFKRKPDAVQAMRWSDDRHEAGGDVFDVSDPDPDEYVNRQGPGSASWSVGSCASTAIRLTSKRRRRSWY